MMIWDLLQNLPIFETLESPDLRYFKYECSASHICNCQAEQQWDFPVLLVIAITSKWDGCHFKMLIIGKIGCFTMKNLKHKRI